MRRAHRALASIAFGLGLYPAAGLIGGALPANSGWRSPTRGVRVYVESNGVHTGLIVPVRAAGVDWRDLAAPEQLGDPRQAGWNWRAIGWGERSFYLETPRWRDARLGTVLHALTGSDRTVVHVEAIPEPRVGPDVRSVVMAADDYHRLAGAIRASVAERPRRWAGYDRNDVFYEGRGRYDAVHDCNEWTGGVLRRAGVRVGRWTPFAAGLMAWF